MAEPFEEKPLSRKVITVMILCVIYFVIAVPFQTLSIVPGFTNVRPLMVLEPIYGIFYGIPGCLVMGICNLAMDAATNSVKLSSAAGLLANVLGALCFHVYWKYLSGTDFDLRSLSNIVKYLLIVVFTAVMSALLITSSVAHYYPDTNYVAFGGVVFMNGLVFPILLGIPVIILMQEELGFVPCRRKQLKINKSKE